MRIECPACSQTCEAELVRATPQSATFVCGGCAAETTEAVARIAKLAASAQPSNAGDNPCPKCTTSVPDGATSCPSCGLAVSKFESFSGSGPSASPELVSAWARAEANWERDNYHEDFVAEVSLSGNYKAGALWYRQASSDPERRAKAIEMLDRVQAMATAALMSSKPKLEEEKEPYKNVVILLMVMLFMGAGVGIILMKSGGTTPKKEPASAPGYKPSFAVPPSLDGKAPVNRPAATKRGRE